MLIGSVCIYYLNAICLIMAGNSPINDFSGTEEKLKELRPGTQLTPKYGSIMGIMDLILEFTLNPEMNGSRQQRHRGGGSGCVQGQTVSQKTKSGTQGYIQEYRIRGKELGKAKNQI